MPPTETETFAHSAFLFEDEEELLEGVLPYLREGAEEGQTLLATMPSRHLRALRSELDGDAPAVYLDLEHEARNPGRLISVWHELAAEGGLRAVSETVWRGRDAEEIEECERHEMLLERIFGERRDVAFLCAYDRRHLDEQVLEGAARTHPRLLEDSAPPRPSPAYVGADGADPLAGSLPCAPAESAEIEFDRTRLGAERELLRAAAVRAGLDPTRVDDFVLAGNEIASNSVEHGGGEGKMRVWETDRALRCEVRDSGRITDATVGRLRPAIDQVRGRGVWLANQVADLVQIRSDEEGTVVRLRFDRDRRAQATPVIPSSRPT